MNWVLVFRLCAFSIVMFIIGWFSKEYISNWYLGAVTVIMLAVLIAFILGLLSVRDLYRIIRLREEG